MTRALHAEWTKLSALRSTWWSLVGALAVTVLLTTLVTSSITMTADDDDAMELSLAGVYLGQMAVAALGVMAISSEFTSGMIRTTFAAMPRREHVLAAKAAVVGGLVFGAGLVTCALAYLAGSALLVGDDLAAQTIVRGVVGTSLYLMALAWLSLGIGALLRHTAAAISTVFALLWVPLIVVSMLPMETGLKVARFCPMLAGLAIQRTVERADTIPISPLAGLTLFCVYAAAALGLGLWRLRS